MISKRPEHGSYEVNLKVYRNKTKQLNKKLLYSKPSSSFHIRLVMGSTWTKNYTGSFGLSDFKIALNKITIFPEPIAYR